MGTIRSFVEQSLLIWKDSTAAARFGLILLMFIFIGGVLGVGIWSAQPQYTVLARNLDPQKASKVIDALDAEGIAYDLRGSGSIIMVDKKKWPRAKIAAGMLGIGSLESELEDVSPWMDPLSQNETFRRNRERQLEDTIGRLKDIERADVHLSIPEKQAFIRQRNTPSAAVILELSHSAKFNDSKASAIASMVANAAPGLTADQVSITDTSGNEFTIDDSARNLSKQESFRVAREQQLAGKAERMLSQFLGFGNSSVVVTTDFSFPDGTSITTEFNSEKVLEQETITNSSESDENSTESGTAGTASNTSPIAGSKEKAVVSTKEEQKNTYKVPMTERKETISTPILKLMSVSVLVNSKSVADENQVVPEELKDKIESIVSQAVGFRDGTDQISVEFFEFVDPFPLDGPAAVGIPWDKINQVLKNLSLGLAALVALFIAIKILKKINLDPATLEQRADRTTQVSQLSDLVQQNPEVFSKIIESWSSLDAKPDEQLESKAA